MSWYGVPQTMACLPGVLTDNGSDPFAVCGRGRQAHRRVRTLWALWSGTPGDAGELPYEQRATAAYVYGDGNVLSEC